VGSYINGYGDSIKRSMSSDGPVSSGQKKTAVKPSAPAGKPPSAPKALPPSTLPAKKALPAPSQKGPATPKPATRVPPAKPNVTQKQPPSQKPTPNSKPAGPTSVKSKGPVGVTRPNSAPAKPATNGPKLVSSVNSSGKTMVSPESRPGYRKSAVTRNNPNPMPAKGGDILGIGENFGDISKTRPKDSHHKNSSAGGGGGAAAARKPSASDPLALGDLENIGKKK
jgi:hypothetical protein